MKMEFLMKAHTYGKAKNQPSIGGWFMSEKLDGMRCFWDGGISRGIPKKDIPWANNDKDERYVTPPIATGLWSFYGNVIHASDNFVAGLPRVPLDGELYADMPRQDMMRIVKSIEPSEDWNDVTLRCFDMPSLERVFMDRVINNTHFKKTFKNIITWIKEYSDYSSLIYYPKMTTPFCTTVKLMQKYCTGTAVSHPQTRLPFQTDAAIDLLNHTLDEVVSRGGEGVMIRKAESIWVPIRSHDILKVKDVSDMEGTVKGYITGRRTDKGSKLLGKMGALILQLPNGKTLELSGFTDEERELNNPEWAANNPEMECPEDIEAIHFPRGMQVTFKYRGLSNDGIPQEARYWRRRED